MILMHHCLNLSRTAETFENIFLGKELSLNLNQLDLFETLPNYSLWENPNILQKMMKFQPNSHLSERTNEEELLE